mgnify:CR=1 FL=1
MIKKIFFLTFSIVLLSCEQIEYKFTTNTYSKNLKSENVEAEIIVYKNKDIKVVLESETFYFTANEKLFKEFKKSDYFETLGISSEKYDVYLCSSCANFTQQEEYTQEKGMNEDEAKKFFLRIIRFVYVDKYDKKITIINQENFDVEKFISN